MSEKFKLVKIFSFVAIVVAIIIALSAVITPNGTTVGITKYEKSKIWAMDERENSIDVLFLGDSEVYCAISPLEIWDEYGYATFDCSSGQVRSYESYDLLQAILTKQSPQIVFIEANFLYREYDRADIIYDKIYENLPLFKYHDVWKSYIDRDHEYESLDKLGYKGYRHYNIVQPAKNTNYMVQTDNVWDIDSVNKSYFDKIVTLCQDEGIEVVLLSSPSVVNWSYSKHNAMAQLADKYELPYIDLNLTKDLDIDWKKDTKDLGDHVNHRGAVKVSRWLGKYLDENYDLVDHRDEPEYQDWNDLLVKYKEKTKPKDKPKK